MSVSADQMQPDASPGTVAKNPGVRRVNNMPMYLLGGVLGAFLVVMALVAADRAARQNTADDDSKTKPGSTSMFAREIAGDQTGGLIEPAKVLVPEMQESQAPEAVLIARPDNLDAPPKPPAQNNQPVIDEEANRIRQAKMQMFEEAVKAKTGVQVSAPRSAGSVPGNSKTGAQTREEMLARLAALRQQTVATSADPTEAYKTRLAQLRKMGLGHDGGSGEPESAPTLQPEAGDRGINSYAQFDKSDAGQRWKLDSRAEAPRTPYELRAGFVVPATLISGINSDLPGQIMAQVAQNVYDTATGKWLLIPQGTRLVGSYSSDVAYGQSRVLVAWQRIVFPDGKAMDIGAMPGADSAGYAGFNDQTDNHYLRLYGSALLMSAVTAGISYSQHNEGARGLYGAPSASSVLSAAVGQQLGQATAQLLSKNMNIAPTLEIRPGYRFNVIVTKDLTFSKPYRSFDY
ncbi:MAG TPA: TrbI/VirB10 family protein [Anaerolineae bacterium]|nr:TrbI/VirB10 family protein [Anaerolineae bacterium]